MKNPAILLLIFLAACGQRENASVIDENFTPTSYVDPYIGTGFHGHVFLGANVPFGAVQLGPVNITQGWDWCSGYHYSDSTLIGFAHTHLSGTGIGDLGDLLFMPATGDVTIERGTLENPGYMAFYSHEQEKVQPGYYSVEIEKYGITAELTATRRAGMHRYTFHNSENPHIIIDLERGIGWDAPVETYLRLVNDSTLVGHRFSKGWAADQKIFFAAVFSESIENLALWDGDTALNKSEGTGRQLKGIVDFNIADGNVLLTKVGISPVSAENALENVQHEIPHWDFDNVSAAAEEEWNKELGRVIVEMADEEDAKIFYTSLYHTMIAPSTFNDVNGDYRGADGETYNDTTYTNLTTFSLWDTYRAAHPMYTLLQRDKVDDMVNSMLGIYQQQGKLPVWHLMGNETNTMVGYSAIPVIVDAYLKGFKGFDAEAAYQAVKNTAMMDERGIRFVKEKGYIPADSTVESVAMGLEYAISDGSVAQMAKALGKEDDYQYFYQRSKNYEHYYDPTVRFMRGRLADEVWRTPFSPFVSRHRDDDFCEGNSWQYTWLVPHDVNGLIALLGGDQAFVAKLDSLFEIEGNMGEHASSDITGLIGQYAHGNEPSHHITYLYAYAGEPWKTAEKVRYILDSLYTSQPDGLCGNEDVGQMSAWYVLSALGFYQVNPSNGIFVFGSPKVERAVLKLGDDTRFTIEVENAHPKNMYIQGVTLNGQSYSRSYLTYADILKGGNVVIHMGPTPSKTWGVEKKDRPTDDRN